MFDALEEAIDKLEIDSNGLAIAEALALRDRLDAKINQALAAFDRAGCWDGEGATSLGAWLRCDAGYSPRQAAGMARKAQRIGELPVTTEAWEDGALTGGQIEVICDNIPAGKVELFASHESDIVPCLVGLNVEETITAMRAWKAAATTDDEEPIEPPRCFYLAQTFGGSWHSKGSFDPASGETVDIAMRLAATDDVEGEPLRSVGERRADALVDICRYFLDHRQAQTGGRHRPHLNVIVDLDDLAGGSGRFVNGGSPGAVDLSVLLCDSAIHRVVVSGESAILDYGRATRSVPANLWNAVVIRDEHCRFGACDRRPDWCEAHHVVPYGEGGETNIENLVLACSRHHHILHRPGWSAKLLPDGTFKVTRPDGHVITSRPPRAGPTLWAA